MINKKGSVIDIIIWIVVAFATIAFFGMWIYGFNQMTNILINIPDGATALNVSGAALDTFGQLNTAQTTGLHTLAFIMIFSTGLTILVSNFVVKSHPAFLIVYIMVIIGAIIASVYISNQYESLMVDSVVGSTFQAFTAANFIMLYLPVWTTVLGFFGAIFMFMGIYRDREMGGGIV